MEKSREFSVKESKLKNGQVKLKLAVHSFHKRDLSDSFSESVDCDNSSSNEPQQPTASTQVSGKWRPIGFSSADSSETTSESNDAKPDSSSSTLFTQMQSENSLFSGFTIQNSFVLPGHEQGGPVLKAFQIAGGVKPPSGFSNAVAINQLYRCEDHFSRQQQSSRSTNIYKLVSSGSESEDTNSSCDEGSSISKSHNLSPTFNTSAVNSNLSRQRKNVRKKRGEVDSLLNTWNIAPTAGKLLRQEVIPASSVQRSRRSAKRNTSKLSITSNEDDTKLKDNDVTEETTRPALSEEDLSLVVVKLSKFGRFKSDTSSSASNNYIPFFQHRFIEESFITNKRRYCFGLPASSHEDLTDFGSSSQLPPKKRHKQVTSSTDPLNTDDLLDHKALNSLVSRQSAAISYLRPSLFDLKKDHCERLRKMQATTIHFSSTAKSITNRSKPKVFQRNPKKKVADSVQENSAKLSSDNNCDQSESLPPLKLRISLSKIFPSRSDQNISSLPCESSPSEPNLRKNRRKNSSLHSLPPTSGATGNSSYVFRNRTEQNSKKTEPTTGLNASVPKNSQESSKKNKSKDKTPVKISNMSCSNASKPVQDNFYSPSKAKREPLKSETCDEVIERSERRKKASVNEDVTYGKLLLRKLKSEKKYQSVGLFSDTFKEESSLFTEKDSVNFINEKSPLSSPLRESFQISSPSGAPSDKPGFSGVLPLPPPTALSVLYERSYFELPYDLWIMKKYNLLHRPLHPGENFKRARNNVYTASSKHIFCGKAEAPEPCNCVEKDEKVCLEDCINRQLFVECCPASCPSPAKCANRQFQTGRDFSKISRFETAECGSGVRAKKLISIGEFIIEYTGEVVSDLEFKRRMVEWYSHDQHHYAFNLDSGAVIDAYRMGSLARFVNHSCEPNCQMQKWTVLGLPRVGLFALRNIASGEELSYDYNFNWFDKGSRQVCKCGSANCRGYIGAQVVSKKPIDPKKLIQPLKKWRLANPPRQFSVRERYVNSEGRVVLPRNVKSMSNKLKKLIAKRKRRRTIVISHGGLNTANRSSNSLFVAQFKALSNATSRSSRRLSEADSCGTSKSVDMALFLEQLLTSLTMHRDSNDVQTAKPFMVLPKRKHVQAYYDLVENPIDFSTIERNITTGRYPTFDSFNDDIRLLFQNTRIAGNILLNPDQDVESTLSEMVDTYDKMLVSFEKEITEFRQLFSSTELEDIVRCVCGRLNEEGTMVQCDKCQLWQHGDCVCIDANCLPESYLCYSCSNSKQPVCKEVPLPSSHWPDQAEKNCRYFVSLCTKTGIQVRVDECYTINRQSLPFDVPFCKIDKLYPGIFYINQLFIDESGRKYIHGVHLVYPFEVHVDYTRKYFAKEILATMWYDKLPIEIISGHCWVLDSITYARGRPRTANSEDQVFICDNGLDKHAKTVHKLREPMCSTCTKRYAFDHFLVPLRPERNLTAGEIHEKMFAQRREEMAKLANSDKIVSKSSSSSEEDDYMPSRIQSSVESSKKRSRLNLILQKLGKNVNVELDPDVIPAWLALDYSIRDFEKRNEVWEGNGKAAKPEPTEDLLSHGVANESLIKRINNEGVFDDTAMQFDFYS